MTLTSPPAWPIAARACSIEVTRWPLIATITSPRLIPAAAAGAPVHLLLVGEALHQQAAVLDQAPVAAIADKVLELRVVPGPRDDWFVDPDILIRTNWQVTNRTDRVGMRLIGMPLEYRWPDRQLPSEGATRGAIQVPPNGFPVILGPDHPVTGGYPVIGVVTDEDVDKVAQIRPGQTVRLHWSRPRHPFEG